MNPKLLRALVALSALITALLGAASYIDLLPKDYAAVAGLITTALLGAKEIIVIIGDIADDGVRNNSFKPDAATVRQWTGVIIACLICLFMASCVNLTKEEAQAAAKDIAIEIGLGAGQVTVDVARARLLQAEAEFHEATITPGVGVKNILAKQVAYEAAKRMLDAAERELAKAKAKRAVPAKQPVKVQPGEVLAGVHPGHAPRSDFESPLRSASSHEVNGGDGNLRLRFLRNDDDAMAAQEGRRVTIPKLAPQVIAALQTR